MFIRDPMNDNRKQAIVMDQIKSIESKGVVADARGKMWVIDRPDHDSSAAQGSQFVTLHFALRDYTNLHLHQQCVLTISSTYMPPSF